MLEKYSDILLIEDIMEILRIGRNSAYNLIKTGRLKCIRVGRNIRIPKAFLLDFLSEEYYNDDNNMICAPVSFEEGA